MRRIALVLLATVAVACNVHRGSGSSVRPVGGPSGGGWKSVECNGTHQGCIDAAARVCPSGYELATSGGATEVTGSSYNGTGGVSSKYTGHMLVKCTEGETVTRKVVADDCSFVVPMSWGDDDVDGTTVFHPAGSYDTQVAIDVTAWKGSLQSYADKNFVGYKVEASEIDGHEALIAVKRDDLNSMRITSVAILDRGNVYELTCASKSLDELSASCRRVLRSLHIEKPGL